MAELAEEQFAAARSRGEARLSGPRAVAAHYDAGRGRIVVKLSTGIEIAFAPRDVERLAGASAEDLRVIEVEGVGLGIHFPRLDADLCDPALLAGVLASRRWIAARVGAVDGKARSQAKAAAAHAKDGRRGRTRKAVASG